MTITATEGKAYLVGGGIGALAAAAFIVRDSDMPAGNITIFESLPVLGGSLDGAGNPDSGYSLRGGRMLTTDNFECTWDLFRSIPSLAHPGKSVYEETVDFNSRIRSHSKARLVDRNRAIVDVNSMGFTMKDRLALLKLIEAREEDLGASRITDWFSPEFFTTTFWQLWQTTFTFQAWHSAAECRRYLHRFMKEFSRIETLGGIKRTIYNKYESLVCPLENWLAAQGVNFMNNCTVTDFDLETVGDITTVSGITYNRSGVTKFLPVGSSDLVFLQNGSMTDASSLGSMTSVPECPAKDENGGWSLWEQLAEGRPGFGDPTAFNASIPETCWYSFTVTLNDTVFFDQMETFTGNEAGTGGLVTFKDSRWLISVVLAHQPYFANQPADTRVFWGYALHPYRVGDFVAKPMSECTGADILREVCGHLNFDMNAVFATANCIPCRMPYITSMFMPRAPGDRPRPVPQNSRNLALVSQFVEIPEDTVFTVEYSVRAAQMAVYELLGIDREIPPIRHHDESLKVQFDALIKAFK